MPVSAIPVVDPWDERIAAYRYLTDAALRRAVEQPANGAGLFIAEGTLAIRRLVTSRYEVRSFLLAPRRFEELEPVLDGVDAPVYIAERDVMKAVAGFDVHRGALAAGVRAPLPAPGGLLRSAARVVVLEALNDHENLGVVFRNAAALGVDAAILSPRCADPLYRRTVRVSMGHVLHVPFARLEPWPAGLEQVRRAGFTVAALTPDPAAISVDDADLASEARLALVLGAEGPGLSADALRAADVPVRIPMSTGVDSLNVASAAAIALHLARPR